MMTTRVRLLTIFLQVLITDIQSKGLKDSRVNVESSKSQGAFKSIGLSWKVWLKRQKAFSTFSISCKKRPQKSNFRSTSRFLSVFFKSRPLFCRSRACSERGLRLLRRWRSTRGRRRWSPRSTCGSDARCSCSQRCSDGRIFPRSACNSCSGRSCLTWWSCNRNRNFQGLYSFH